METFDSLPRSGYVSSDRGTGRGGRRERGGRERGSERGGRGGGEGGEEREREEVREEVRGGREEVKCQRENYSKTELSLRKHLLLQPINRLVVSYTNYVDHVINRFSCDS